MSLDFLTQESVLPAPPVLEWSLPVIYDALSEFYAGLAPEGGAAHQALTQAHFALWTTLVLDDSTRLDFDKASLAAQAEALGVNRATCGAANRYVAGELLELILRRCRRMPDEARANNVALLAILSHLQMDFARESQPNSRSQAA